MPTTLTPQSFVARWRTTTCKERAAANEHFIAHRKLDAPVFAAYGWPTAPLTGLGHDLPDEEILSRLLALNLERTALARQRASSGDSLP
jgi:hypothetical protein